MWLSRFKTLTEEMKFWTLKCFNCCVGPLMYNVSELSGFEPKTHFEVWGQLRWSLFTTRSTYNFLCPDFQLVYPGIHGMTEDLTTAPSPEPWLCKNNHELNRQQMYILLQSNVHSYSPVRPQKNRFKNSQNRSTLYIFWRRQKKYISWHTTR